MKSKILVLLIPLITMSFMMVSPAPAQAVPTTFDVSAVVVPDGISVGAHASYSQYGNVTSVRLVVCQSSGPSGRLIQLQNMSINGALVDDAGTSLSGMVVVDQDAEYCDMIPWAELRGDVASNFRFSLGGSLVELTEATIETSQHFNQQVQVATNSSVTVSGLILDTWTRDGKIEYTLQVSLVNNSSQYFVLNFENKQVSTSAVSQWNGAWNHGSSDCNLEPSSVSVCEIAKKTTKQRNQLPADVELVFSSDVSSLTLPSITSSIKLPPGVKLMCFVNDGYTAALNWANCNDGFGDMSILLVNATKKKMTLKLENFGLRGEVLSPIEYVTLAKKGDADDEDVYEFSLGENVFQSSIVLTGKITKVKKIPVQKLVGSVKLPSKKLKLCTSSTFDSASKTTELTVNVCNSDRAFDFDELKVLGKRACCSLSDSSAIWIMKGDKTRTKTFKVSGTVRYAKEPTVINDIDFDSSEIDVSTSWTSDPFNVNKHRLRVYASYFEPKKIYVCISLSDFAANDLSTTGIALTNFSVNGIPGTDRTLVGEYVDENSSSQSCVTITSTKLKRSGGPFTVSGTLTPVP
jgi:hypothetical protein